MILKACHVENFGSYSSLDFDFSDLGLGLVYGPTGSGKSTLEDIPAWALYGVTAKNGAADDVRAWHSAGEPTRVTLEVELPNGKITVTRIRGKASQNDLYWTEDGQADLNRGKELGDTQKRLQKRLGISAETYLSGAYFHEFSPAGSFFTAKAKDRRALLEEIAPLSFPAEVADSATKARKDVRDENDRQNQHASRLFGAHDQLVSARQRTVKSAEDWEEKQTKIIQALESKAKTFQEDKALMVSELRHKASKFEIDISSRIEELLKELEQLEAKIKTPEEFEIALTKLRAQARCAACNGLTDKQNDKIAKVREDKVANELAMRRFTSGKSELKSLDNTENAYAKELDRVLASVNVCAQQAKDERAKTNPFVQELATTEKNIADSEVNIAECGKIIEDLEHEIASLTRLYDLSFLLRGELLRQTIKNIEDGTNRYLEKYFDAELRVGFELDSDNLEVSIQKSGYACNFRQLSKGQRGLLRLCFVASIMKAAANNAGVHFDNVFFDEALDGLDTDLKVRAYKLFEELETEHGTVLVIDHATELKAMFAKRYQINIVGDVSELTLEESQD